MIVARLTRAGQFLFHGSGEVTGSPAGEDYRMGGWFPIESFGFGFQEEKKEPTPAPSPASKSGGATTASKPPVKPATGAGSGGSSESKMQMTKHVDRATCDLMVLAMEERSQKKGENKESEYHADIHVVGTVGFKDEGGSERFVYPSLMVHLEGVHVVEWKIDGSGDQRPNETLTLLYDRVAIHYLWTGDGKEFLPIGPKGWDQTENEQWPNGEELPDSVFKKFLPKFK